MVRKTVEEVKPQRTRRVVSNTLANASGAQVDEANGTSQVSADTVTVTVPKAFVLTADDHTPYAYPVGVQEMLKDHAEHWFARAQGVELYQR